MVAVCSVQRGPAKLCFSYVCAHVSIYIVCHWNARAPTYVGCPLYISHNPKQLYIGNEDT